METKIVNQIVGRRLKEFRAINNISRKEMAEKLGVIPNYISQIESGSRNLPIKYFFEIYNIYGLNPSWLFNENEQNSLLKENHLLSKYNMLLRDMKSIIDSYELSASMDA